MRDLCNPVYTGEHNNSDSVKGRYPIYEDVSLGKSMSNHQSISVTALNPTYMSSDLTMSRNQFEMLDFFPEALQKQTESNGYRTNGEDRTIETVIVPTDPVTGYSILRRPEKVKPSANKAVTYESIQIENEPIFLKPTTDKVKGQNERLKDPALSHLQTVDNTPTSDMSASESRVPGPQESLKPSAIKTMSCDSTVSEVEGYCVLKDGRPQVPSELGPVYDTINLTTKFSDSSAYPAKKKVDQSVSEINNSNRGAASIIPHPSSEMSTSSVPRPQESSANDTVTSNPSSLPEMEGYCVLKDDRPQLPSDLSLVYDTINLTPKKRVIQAGTGMNSSGHDATSSVPQPSTVSSSTLPDNYTTVPQSQDLVDFQTVPTDPETGYSKMIRPEKSHQLPSRPIPGYDTVKVELDGNPRVKLKTDVSSMAVESSQPPPPSTTSLGDHSSPSNNIPVVSLASKEESPNISYELSSRLRVNHADCENQHS